MNILFLSELFYPHGSGAELATFLYADLLSKVGIDVAVITNQFPGESFFSKRDSLKIYRLPFFKQVSAVKYSILKRFDFLISSFFKKMLEWADIVYVPRFWFSAIAFAKAHGKRIIVHLHDYIPVCSLSTLHDEKGNASCLSNRIICSPKCIYFFEKSYRKSSKETLSSVILNSSVGCYLPRFSYCADSIICVSNKQRDLIVNRAKWLAEKSHVISNPYPVFPEEEISGDYFGYFGGPNTLKGFSVLCKALIHLSQSGQSSLKVHSTKFESCSKDFATLLNRLGFFLHSKLGTEAFGQMYREIRSVIVPSVWHEPWPYVIVEALVRGRFVVASNIGGIPEQVKDCKGAILFDAGNFKALADSIKFVSELSRKEIVDLGQENRRKFLSKFNNDCSVKKFIKLCENLS